MVRIYRHFFFRSFTITENIQNILICLTDPWLIRKETKKSKEKKNKKKKSIDPDSIQSALLASGLGTTRPTFTAPAVKPSNNSVPVGESNYPHRFVCFHPGVVFCNTKLATLGSCYHSSLKVSGC